MEQTLDKKKISRMSRVETALICRGCGSTKWGFHVTVCTEFDSNLQEKGETKQVGEEFRCSNCQLKANLENNAALRKMSSFKKRGLSLL